MAARFSRFAGLLLLTLPQTRRRRRFLRGGQGLVRFPVGFEIFKLFHLLQICTKCTFRPVAGLFQPLTAWRLRHNRLDHTQTFPPSAARLPSSPGPRGGLGYETALALAGAGAVVILTGRNEAKGLRAIERIRAQFPNALIAYEHLDLASLASVADFAKRFAAGNEDLDLLINNAGVMALPKRQQTEDGFEMQLGTNYLGHYALTAQLLPKLRRAKAPRVVNLFEPCAPLRRDQFR